VHGGFPASLKRHLEHDFICRPEVKKGLYEMALRTAYTLIHFLSIKNSDFFILNFITIDWTIDQIFLSK